MNSDRTAEMLFLVLALALPLSALISRRISLGETVRMVAIWTIIIVAVALLVQAVRASRLHAYILHNIYYQDV